MFPEMYTVDMKNIIDRYCASALEWKVSGSGGGGCFMFISAEPIPEAKKIVSGDQ